MELDINPNWPVFVTYDPPTGALAGPANGSDFITMSARTTARSA